MNLIAAMAVWYSRSPGWSDRPAEPSIGAPSRRPRRCAPWSVEWRVAPTDLCRVPCGSGRCRWSGDCARMRVEDRFRNVSRAGSASQQTLRKLRERRGNRSTCASIHADHFPETTMTDSTLKPSDLRALPDPADPRGTAEAIMFEIRRVIVGQDAMLERVLVGLLSGGHLLLEGVPGLAKTLTIKTLADVLGGTFKRIQFTPDLMPSDLVGTRIYRPDRGSFEVEQGPVFANFLLADEINRAPAKVQSRAARGDAGAPGHDRSRHVQGPDPVPRPGHREPDRSRGHLPAARGPGRPVHAQDPARLPEPVGRGADRRPLAGRREPAARDPRCGRPAPTPADRRPRSTSTRASSATRSAWSRRPAS